MKKKINKLNLRQRLINYSLASAAIILGTENINAQIWGFDVEPDEVLDTNFETLNIDFDSNHRFTLRYRDTVPYNFVSFATPFPTASASWLFRTGGRAKALSSGYVISAGKSFSNSVNRKRFADLQDGGGGFISGSSFLIQINTLA